MAAKLHLRQYCTVHFHSEGVFPLGYCDHSYTQSADYLTKISHDHDKPFLSGSRDHINKYGNLKAREFNSNVTLLYRFLKDST
jgi:hypothetical protein